MKTHSTKIYLLNNLYEHKGFYHSIEINRFRYPNLDYATSDKYIQYEMNTIPLNPLIIHELL